MSIDPIFWLIAAIGFLVLEGMTFNMTSIWFAMGSAAALLTCLFSVSFRVQAVVFLAVSTLSLLAFRPLAKKLRVRHTATNGDPEPRPRSHRPHDGHSRNHRRVRLDAWTGTPAAPLPVIPCTPANPAGSAGSTALCSSSSRSGPNHPPTDKGASA